jgi:flagellar motor protein MotB
MQRPNPRLAGPPPADLPGFSVAAVLALSLGAAGFGFGAFFYLVPFQRKSAEVTRLTKDLQRASAQPVATRPSPVEEREEATQAQLKALEGEVRQRLGPLGVTTTIEPHRLRIRFAEERLFDARGPYLSKSGQEALQTLGQLLGDRVQRVVIAAPMGGATVPRWIRGELPTPADLSAARSGTVLKMLIKGGVRAPTVFAVIGSLAADDPAALATLDVEVEP